MHAFALTPDFPRALFARVRTGAAATPDRAERFQRARELLQTTGFTDAGQQWIAGVGEMESYYGLAGSFAPNGDPSYNWGAITGTGTAGSIYTSDHDKDGNLIKSVAFQKFRNAREGLAKFLQVVIHPGTGQEGPAIDEINRGDAMAISTRMYRNGYYVSSGKTDEERIANYARASAGVAAAYAKAIGQPPLVTTTGGTPGGYTPAGTPGNVVTLDPVIITADPKESSSGGGGLLLGGLAAVAVGAALVKAFA